MSDELPRRDRERRAAFRVPVCLPVMAECEAFSRGFVTKDVSESGIYLIGELGADPGRVFSLELRLPGGLGTVRAAAAVARVQGDTPRGVGLTWVRLAEAELARLRDMDRRWQAAFPSRSQRP
jgi:hypothetical protein